MSEELMSEYYSKVVDALGCRGFIDDAWDRVSPFIRWNNEGKKFRNTPMKNRWKN